MKFESDYRVPYADTDQMRVVYYANYFVYFERSRTDMLRSMGFPYREMESLGFLLPVYDAYCRYKAPAEYDDLLLFRSWITELRGVRVKICTEVLRREQLLVTGFVTLACVNMDHRPVRPPEIFLEKCRPFYEGDSGEWKNG